jgi:hypothetical protein
MVIGLKLVSPMTTRNQMSEWTNPDSLRRTIRRLESQLCVYENLLDEKDVIINLQLQLLKEHQQALTNQPTPPRPEPGDLYRHFKGSYYLVDGIAFHTEDREDMVVYHDVKTGHMRCTSIVAFLETVRYTGLQVPRFSKVTTSMSNAEEKTWK